MSKICGYSCEHNKSGVCQISVCDKSPIMSDKTEVQTPTRYIDTTITKLQQENKQLKEDIKNIIKILDKNCDDLEATEEEFDSLDRWQGLQVVELEQGSDSNE